MPSAERATLAQDTLNAVIADALALDSTPEIVQCRDRLAMVGYVWKPPGAGDRWQPGIPSLMRYVPSPVRAGRVCVQTGIASSHASPEPFDRESRPMFETLEQIRDQLRAGEGRASRVQGDLLRGPGRAIPRHGRACRRAGCVCKR